ncbi:MAG: zinc metalloprotease HtpX [Phascolarctobacterium sp.]|nr:zinc metalloprotease HtpX [Phascolarctobacterium sp.]
MRTALLMAILTALLMLLGDFFGGLEGMTVMLIFGIGMNLYYYWNSASLVLAQYQAREITEANAPELFGIVRKLATRAEIPMPKIYVIPENVPNAFATGRDPEHAVVAVNSGLVDILDRDEVEGVLAHEISHIKHRDILISTIAACMASAINTIAHWGLYFGGGRDDNNRNPIVAILVMIVAPIIAAMLQMSISRSREYEADAYGGEISGKPDALADALLKIESYAKRVTMRRATETTAHMFIINPFSGKDLKSLFSTHPSTEERVKLLREQAKKLKSVKK